MELELASRGSCCNLALTENASRLPPGRLLRAVREVAIEELDQLAIKVGRVVLSRGPGVGGIVRGRHVEVLAQQHQPLGERHGCAERHDVVHQAVNDQQRVEQLIAEV